MVYSFPSPSSFQPPHSCKARGQGDKPDVRAMVTPGEGAGFTAPIRARGLLLSSREETTEGSAEWMGAPFLYTGIRTNDGKHLI